MSETKKDIRYSYPLKLDGKLKKPLADLAKRNRRKINDEINIAVQNHIEKDKSK